MGIKDCIITPLYLLVFTGIAYVFRNRITDQQTKEFFISGLLIRFFGAIVLGMVYRFYYTSGDTFIYWEHGSRHIWNAFWDSPKLGLKLLFANQKHMPETFEYSSQIWYFSDAHSYFIVRMAAIFDFFTFHTYTATALFFAIFNFTGLWKLYLTFNKLFPGNHKVLAYSILFVPSVFFWGSGILKDTVTLSALCWCVYCMVNIVEFKKNIILNAILFIFFAWILFSVKKYILISFLAAAIVYVYASFVSKISNSLVRVISAPIILAVFLLLGYLALGQVASGDSRYALENIAETAKITAYDIRYGWGARNGDNSGYTLGELDGTWLSMIKLMPSAINVSLFRPYIWEVKNPLMLLSAIESLLVLILSLRVITKTRMISQVWKSPFLRFCFVFSMSFAFAVGVSTFNFGSLARYKIPLYPFYMSILVVSVSNTKVFKKNETEAESINQITQ